jgi:hypothetical protein
MIDLSLKSHMPVTKPEDKQNLRTVDMLFYTFYEKKYPNRSYTFSSAYYIHYFRALSGSNVTPISQVRMSAMLLIFVSKIKMYGVGVVSNGITSIL